MLVKINGDESEIPDDFSIRDLISARDLPPDAVFVALNNVIVRRQLWESTRLKPRDNLEIIIPLPSGG
jgi:thiamine biosynthesis protein ThiS